MAEAVCTVCSGPNRNGEPIPEWSKTITEYDVMEKFPQLLKRFETGLDCLTIKERFDLQLLADERGKEIASQQSPLLCHKVSLVAGGNIAELSVDAVVNAANISLTTGKGVNGAIHSAAGEKLLAECKDAGGCEVGEAKLTFGYNLPATHVIHTVGPEEQDENRAELLRQCYSNCLNLCLPHGLRSIAFPCISTGQFRYPSVEAADTALSTVRQWLLCDGHHDSIDRVVFVTRKLRDEEVYSTLMRSYFPVSSNQ